MSGTWIPNPSVNIKWVDTWHNIDVEKWIKTLQDMQLIEGKKNQQANIMTQIIKSRQITGKELGKSDTVQKLQHLFLGKITQKTALLLRENLNMERAMFSKKELSKRTIKSGKWTPRKGERIRVVDLKYKPWRSYESEIMKIGNGYIIIRYGGYTNTDRLNRQEWEGRITILEDKPSIQQASSLSSKSSKNILPQDISARGLPRPKSVGPKQVPPTDPQLIHPFRNKKVKNWNPDDVSDWVQNLDIQADAQYHASIKKNKRNFASAATVNRVTGKELKKFSSAEKIFNGFSQYGITLNFCTAVYNQLRAVLAAEQAFVDEPKFASRPVDKWTSQDLQAWINSLNLEEAKKKKAVAVIKQDKLTGADFADVKSGHDMSESLHIDTVTAIRLYHELQKLKPVSSTSPPSYKEVQASDVKTNESFNSYLKQGPEEYEFHDGQRIQAYDGKGWFPAVIKIAQPNRVKIGWNMENSRYIAEKYDHWIPKLLWDSQIRDPVTKQPFSAGVDASAGFTDSTGAVRQGNRNQGQGQGQGQGKAYKWKHIDQWTCDELQDWIKTLNLGKKNQHKILSAVAEQEITGADFNSNEEVQEIQDSFEINKIIANKIFNALNTARSNTKDDFVNVSKRSSGSLKSGRGIIGLDNLTNTCFINSVIQCLLQTPGLVEYLRKYGATYGKEKSGVFQAASNWWNGRSTPIAANMLESFIEVAAAAMQSTGRYDSMAPKSIVQHLRNSDVKFGRGEQGDALSAVSKMTELLDKQIVTKQKRAGKGKGAKKHPGQWHVELKKDDPDFDDDEVTEYQFMQYNPYESPIRDHIHFVERNILTCLKCGWQEARYDIREKVLLPLEDHSTTIFIDVYIPSINQGGPVLTRYECVVLDYCAIQTLRYQIFDEIRTNKDIQFDMKNVDQISIRTLKVDKKKLLRGWIEECDAKEDCSTLTKAKRSIFAVIDPKKKKDQFITVTTFNVCLNNKGNADPKACYLEFENMKRDQIKSFNKSPDEKNYPIKDMRIYFGERVYNSNEACQISHANATIVVIWTNRNAKQRFHWQQAEIRGIDPIWQCEIWNHYSGNITNYGDCVQFVSDKIEGYKDFAKTLDSASKKAFTKEWIEKSLSAALEAYQGLANNQNRAIELVYQAFAKGGKSSMKKGDTIVEDIGRGFETYCSTKVLDRGASLKCGGKCKKKCQVFKQETKIVRFSDVLIFAIDRYISGEKFEEVVEYEDFATFDGKDYELYGVCNHSGTNNYGHYWAYVKGYNDNNWYEANDNRISGMDVRNVVGRESAILLFYKQKKGKKSNK